MKRLAIILLLVLGASLGARAQRYDRGYEGMMPSQTFVKKGTWMIGGSARYSQHLNSDYSFLVINGINSDGYTISASPVFCYMVKDNMGVGARFSYGRSLLDIDSAELSVSQISMSVDDYYKLSQDYTAVLLYRAFIPLGYSGRFSMFAELQLGGSVGRSKNMYTYAGEVKGTFEQKYKLMFGVNPGFTAFLTNHLALEANVGLMGVSYSWLDQTHNQVETGSRDFTQASFIVNLLSIGIGICYYL